jgi:hypothetical protein
MVSIEDSTTEPGIAAFAFFDHTAVETKVKTAQTPAAAEDEHSPGPSKKARPSLNSTKFIGV